MKTKLNFFIIGLTLCVCFSCKPEDPTVSDALVACFKADKTSCNINDCEIIFDATCSTPNSDIISYKWDFEGDGIFSPNGKEIVTHTYQTAGTYQVKLQIQLANGTIAETMQTIQVNSIISNFEVPEGIIYQGCEITFNNSSQGASSYLWDFGDGVTSNEENPVHKYSNSGTYTVSLTSILETETQKTTQTINITPNIKFEQISNNSGSSSYKAVVIAPDGGYVLAGSTDSKGAGGSDIYLTKTDANGNLLWEQTFGGSENDVAFALSIAPDGGYVLAGYTHSKGAGGSDAYLIKTDANGNLQWEKTFGGSNWDQAYALTIAPDGGYVLAGFTIDYGVGGLDAYLIKTDTNGNLQWDKTFGGGQDDLVNAITIAPDGGYVLAGYSVSGGPSGFDAYLIKTDANGNLQWETTFVESDEAYALTIAPDGGYIIAGSTSNKGAGSFDAYLIKTDTNGILEWDRTFGGSEEEYAYAITVTPDEGYMLVGSTGSKYTGGNEDAYLIKTDTNGNLQWEQTFGANEFDEAKAIAPTNDCGYIIAGRANSEFYLIKTDSEGNIN